MRVVLSARVETDLAKHLNYGIQHFGYATAEQTFRKVDAFLTTFLPSFPKSGKWIEEARVYACWIARTPFVVMYRIDDASGIITVLAVFHRAQDRSSFDPDTSSES